MKALVPYVAVAVGEAGGMGPVLGENLVDIGELAASRHDRGEIVQVFGAGQAFVKPNMVLSNEGTPYH